MRTCRAAESPIVSWKFSAIEIDAAENTLGARVTRIIGDHGKGKLTGSRNITGAEPSYGSIDSNIRIVGSEFESFVELARGFLDAEFGHGKIADLAEAESNGFVVVAFGFGEVAGGEGGLGGFETALEKNSGIVGGTNCCSGKRGKNKEEYSFRTTTRQWKATGEQLGERSALATSERARIILVGKGSAGMEINGHRSLLHPQAAGEAW